MSPHLHAAMMQTRAAEIARNAERHHEAPRRERTHAQARPSRAHRAFALLRIARQA
jgi:hypothetical protein